MKTLNFSGHPTVVAAPGVEIRANMYGVLASVFLRPPEPDLIQVVSSLDLLNEFASLYGRNLTTRNFGKAVVPDPATLRQEYMDLFSVPTGRYVFPFEDVYRGAVSNGSVQRKGPLLGPCAAAVKTLYIHAGAQMHADCRELPTHIGVELSFMNFLCQRESEVYEDFSAQTHGKKDFKGVLDKIRRIELAFLTEHLNEWFPQLSRAIQANANVAFYREFALLVEKLLSWDTATLLESPRPDAER